MRPVAGAVGVDPPVLRRELARDESIAEAGDGTDDHDVVTRHRIGREGDAGGPGVHLALKENGHARVGRALTARIGPGMGRVDTGHDLGDRRSDGFVVGGRYAEHRGVLTGERGVIEILGDRGGPNGDHIAQGPNGRSERVVSVGSVCADRNDDAGWDGVPESDEAGQGRGLGADDVRFECDVVGEADGRRGSDVDAGDHRIASFAFADGVGPVGSDVAALGTRPSRMASTSASIAHRAAAVVSAASRPASRSNSHVRLLER